ncbi:MAG: cysteine desulfurase [Verrucomicrobia bacterium]|nr:cysteine desulfurase [Verrucomicrobiota bacterium]
MIELLDSVELEEIRDDFPLLAQRVHGKPLIYFDNAATSQKPRAVIEAMNDYYHRYNANVHRGIHALAERATREYELARAKVARFLNAETPDTIIFTRGTTESINLVAQTWGRANLKPGDEILLTWMEHHSNLVPWYQLAASTGALIRRIPLLPDGTLDLSQPFSERTKLVAVTHASNVLGTINPVRQIADAAHRIGAVVLVDGAQAAPHLAVDVPSLGCDFYALSGHKMLGPTGSGVLYGKRALLAAMPPFLGGGEMIREVRADGFTCNELPYKFEAGTPAIAEAIGLGVAVDYLAQVGLQKIRQHEQELTAYTLARMAEFPEIVVYGPADASARSGLVAFTMGDIHPHDMATFLDADGIAIRAGHHCAQPLHKHLGLTATSRASFYLYNTRSEVDAFIEALRKTKNFFGACPTSRQLGVFGTTPVTGAQP